MNNVQSTIFCVMVFLVGIAVGAGSIMFYNVHLEAKANEPTIVIEPERRKCEPKQQPPSEVTFQHIGVAKLICQRHNGVGSITGGTNMGVNIQCRDSYLVQDFTDSDKVNFDEGKANVK